jgi:PhnB protein
MKMNPYLNFDGQCEAAFKFYADVLGGEIVAKFTFGETPACEHVPADFRDRMMHVHLVAGDVVLMGSDGIPDHPCEGVKGFSVALQVDKAAEAERIFHALAENGTVQMPIQETFWSDRFGMLVDRFGVPWMVNCTKAA